jgi:HCO3- transporter family
MPVKHHGTEPFVRRVPTWKMHIFTFVQVCALAMLWAVKSSPFSLAFPFFLIMMLPIRMVVFERIFTPLELRAVRKVQAFMFCINLNFFIVFSKNSSMEVSLTMEPKTSQISSNNLPFQHKQFVSRTTLEIQ